MLQEREDLEKLLALYANFDNALNPMNTFHLLVNDAILFDEENRTNVVKRFLVKMIKLYGDGDIHIPHPEEPRLYRDLFNKKQYITDMYNHRITDKGKSPDEIRLELMQLVKLCKLDVPYDVNILKMMVSFLEMIGVKVDVGFKEKYIRKNS